MTTTHEMPPVGPKRDALVGEEWMDAPLGSIDPIQERNRELAREHGARIPQPSENVAPSHLAGGFEWMHGVGFGPLDEDADDAPLAAARQLIDDLVTCIDVCEAMARAIDCLVCRTNEIGGEEFDRLQNLIFAIRQVHDVAHLLTGGERMSRWIAVDELVEHDDPDFGPAWPDVRRRMADVLERAERMAQ